MADRWLMGAIAPLVPLALALAAPDAPALREIDAGPTVPSSPYVSYLVAGENQTGVIQGWQFPITTALKPGILKPSGAPALDARWLTQPVFLLGSDEASLTWLARNAAALRRMDAAGIVMESGDAAAFKHVQKLATAQMLPVAPGPDHWLEEQLLKAQVNVLPVLIGVDGRVIQELRP